MRRIKYLFWLIIAAILVAFIYQNKEFFVVQRSIGIDLPLIPEYQSPELPTGVYYLAVFVIGMLVSYFASLSERFRNRRTIRELNEKIVADEKRINQLETQTDSQKDQESESAESKETDINLS